jgi:beta-phosphoglucomutase-like phosphatase (HAD superfamily)
VIRGLLFDLDGVLVDTAGYHFEAWQYIAAELGIPFGEAQNEQLKGVSGADYSAPTPKSSTG